MGSRAFVLRHGNYIGRFVVRALYSTLVMKLALALLILSTSSHVSTALACGFCGGDKAASVYSFKNKKFAERTDSRYVSAELAGEGDRESFAKVVATLKRLKGVFPKTVRGEHAQRAVSFVHRPDVEFAEIARGVSRGHPGWSLKLLE
jgi:hypothetical protein